jgi:hypothetical protein
MNQNAVANLSLMPSHLVRPPSPAIIALYTQKPSAGLTLPDAVANTALMPKCGMRPPSPATTPMCTQISSAGLTFSQHKEHRP